MKSAIFMNGNKFDETVFSFEEAFEKVVKEHSKTFFGAKSVYFDIKSKIDSKTFGSAIPDGFLFVFRDEENPEFYLVEVELEKHDFYNHIFPQITKFFAFFKNPSSRNNLIEKLHSFIKSNPQLEEQFRLYLGKKEIYKALKDVIENSQNILIVLDDEKSEMQEVFDTYTDTWGKMVRVEILKQYSTKTQTIFTLNPDFEDITFVGETKESGWQNWEMMVKDFDEPIRKATLNLITKLNALTTVVYRGKTRCSAYIKQVRGKYGFVGIIPTKSELKIIIRYDATISDPKGFLSPKSANWFTAGSEKQERSFKIRDESQVDYAFDLVKQSYEIIKKREFSQSKIS